MTRKGRVKFKLPSGWWVQKMTDRMSKACSSCGSIPDGVRVICTADGYPFPTTSHYCVVCATKAMQAKVDEDASLISNFKNTYLKALPCITKARASLTSSDSVVPTVLESPQPRVRYALRTRR